MAVRKKWQQKLISLLPSFPYPWFKAQRSKIFLNQMNQSLTDLIRMKHRPTFEKSEIWRSYYGESLLPDYSNCKNAMLPNQTTPIAETLDEVIELFHGMPIWAHPQSMLNVLPSVNSAAVIAATLTNMASPNFVEGEVSWNIAKAELESIAMMADLLGWKPAKAGGVFTFGGTGCYLYALKLAITRIMGKETRYKGLHQKGVVIVSKVGHYAKKTCTDWLGLGMDQVIEIDVDEKNAMRIPHLEAVMRECNAANRPIIMIVATMGTTDAFAIDPIRDIRRLIDRYKPQQGRNKPFLYADAVIGWAWLVYKKYSFSKNPLGFSKEALYSIRQGYQALKYIGDADAIGIDFHKTGWCPYSSSLFVVKNNEEMIDLLARKKPAYIATHTAFNPFLYTLETSRSGAPAVAAWATLKHFGYEGFQVLLGRIIEVKLFFKKLLEHDTNLICINADNHGLPTLFRVYPSHLNAKKQYHAELNDPAHRDELYAYNKLQQLVANKLFAMLRVKEAQVPGWENPPFISLSAGYRPPYYALQETNYEYWVFALKSFPVSPFANELSMMVLRNYILKARDLVIAELLSEANKHSKIRTNQAKAWFGPCSAIPKKYLLGKQEMPAYVMKPKVSSLEKKALPPAEIDAAIQAMLVALPYFYHLTKLELERLLQYGRIKKLFPGRLLCKEGDPAKHAYLIIEGELQVYTKVAGQSREKILGRFGRGSFLGEMALFEKGTRSANIKAGKKSATVFVIDGRKLARFLNPEK